MHDSGVNTHHTQSQNHHDIQSFDPGNYKAFVQYVSIFRTSLFPAEASGGLQLLVQSYSLKWKDHSL